MAEIATIARPYAEALFKASSADLVSTSKWLNELGHIASDLGLMNFVNDPKTTQSQAYDLIAGVLQSPLTVQGKNFLQTVLDNGRLDAVPQIASQFRSLCNASSGVLDATVFSAFALDSQALQNLQPTLEKRFGRRLNLQVVVDSSLIGGIRVQVGDEVFDTSIKAQLAQMKMALTA